MNKRWSLLNKSMQENLKREETFNQAWSYLFTLRDELMQEFLEMKNELSRDDFNKMPYINAKGFHNKTIAYSIWHIFRIEDIVVNSLIKKQAEVFANYKEKIKSPIITTGNELIGTEIMEFSQKLDLDELYNYSLEVKNTTEDLLRSLSYSDLKRRFDEDDKKRIEKLKVVSTDEKANFLIDYWCDKNVLGLIKMPLSRHWIMHTEASIRIKNRICVKKQIVMI